MAAAVYSPGVLLIGGILFGALCVVLARRCQQLKGVYPWKMHPAVWFVIGFFFGLLGFILCAISRATTKPPQDTFYGYGSFGQPPASPGPPWQSPPSGSNGGSPSYPPAYPPANPSTYPPAYPGTPPWPPGTVPPAPGAAPSTGARPVPGPAPLAAPPPGWNPDPSGRNELRYWDGTQWTEHVSNSGTPSTDPL